MTTPPVSSTPTSLSSLERQRQHLESTIRDLQTSLYNWRLWEAEYDGLKLALQENRGNNGSDTDAVVETGNEKQDMLRVALEYISSSSSSSSASPGEKSVLSEKEVRDIVSGGKSTRTREQVVSLLDRRIDYVRENVRVLEKRLADAERKLENWMGAIAVEDEEESDGKGKGSLLPVTEIVEELDEEGNVLKGQTMRAGESAAELLDMLKKAGVEGLEERKKGGEKVSEESSQAPAAKEVATSAPTLSQETRETVSSAGQSAAPAENAPSVSNVSRKSTSTNGTVPDDGKGEDDGSIVMEVDESPEDAALRREMIQYGLQEVGAVVAEFELDDDGSEFSVSDDDYDYDDEEDEDEDEYGRSTRRMIDEDYHRQMRELEQKLNARGIQNIGPDASVLPAEVQRELNGELKKVSLQELDDNNLPEKKSNKPKKRVAFAEELDIAPDPAPAPSQLQTKKKDKVVTSPEVAPIQEQVIERTERDRTIKASETKPPKKVSRFRSAREAKESTPAATPTLPTMPQSNPPRVQTNPSPQNILLFPAKPSEPKPFSQPIIYPDEQSVTPGVKPTPTKILQDTLVERPMVSNPSSAPAAPEHDPDDFDEAIHQREIASEFYRLRNRKIQQEGGFLEDEPDIIPINEDEDANEEPRGGRKMSRFMAARLKQQQ